MDGQVRDHPSAAAVDDGAPSTSGGSANAPAHHYADADDDNAGGGGGGPKVWVLVLLFALLLLPFLPSAMRRGGGTPWAGGGGGTGGGGYRRGGINFKSGWDVVNLCLVLFAILCGLLGRSSGGGGDGDSSSSAATSGAPAKDDHRLGSSAHTAEAEAVTAATTSSGEWEGYDDSMSAIYASLSRTNHAHASGIRRMKSSSSYPELRLGSDGVWALASPEAAWRFYDDAELYRARRPERQERTWDVDPHGRTTTTTTEVKTIPVDTFVERGRTEQPREPRRRRRSVERLPRMAEVDEERPPQQQQQRGEALATPRLRRWNSEVVDVMPEQQATVAPARSRRWDSEVVRAVPEPEAPVAPTRLRRRNSESLDSILEQEARVAPARSMRWDSEVVDAMPEQFF